MSTHPLSKEFKPKVDQLVLNHVKSPLERYIVEKLSLGEQVMAAQNHVLISVEDQAKKTNGRVTQHDRDFILRGKEMARFKARLDSVEKIFIHRQKIRKRVIALAIAAVAILSPTAGEVIKVWVLHLIGR